MSTHPFVATSPRLVPVRSCFGGMAVYSLSALRASRCEYDERGSECEHVSFHQCLEAHRPGSVLIDPASHVFYDHVSSLSAK